MCLLVRLYALTTLGVNPNNYIRPEADFASILVFSNRKCTTDEPNLRLRPAFLIFMPEPVWKSPHISADPVVSLFLDLVRSPFFRLG